MSLKARVLDIAVKAKQSLSQWGQESLMHKGIWAEAQRGKIRTKRQGLSRQKALKKIHLAIAGCDLLFCRGFLLVLKVGEWLPEESITPARLMFSNFHIDIKAPGLFCFLESLFLNS